jgi:hypothetical protein
MPNRHLRGKLYRFIVPVRSLVRPVQYGLTTEIAVAAAADSEAAAAAAVTVIAVTAAAKAAATAAVTSTCTVMSAGAQA